MNKDCYTRLLARTFIEIVWGIESYSFKKLSETEQIIRRLKTKDRRIILNLVKAYNLHQKQVANN